MLLFHLLYMIKDMNTNIVHYVSCDGHVLLLNKELQNNKKQQCFLKSNNTSILGKNKKHKL
jgi:hypothetical protein